MIATLTKEVNTSHDELEKQFNHYWECLTNEQYWYSNKFRVLNHEAGTGKTLKTFEFFGKMYKEGYNYKILYVQYFSKDNSLIHTINYINDEAGAQIAGFIDSRTTKSAYKDAINAQVLCITHAMYREICKGKHKNLIRDRDILVIDEFPNLYEEFVITKQDIRELLKFSDLDDNVKKLHDYILRKINENSISKNKMKIIKFNDENIHKIIKRIYNIVHSREEKKFLYKFKKLFENVVVLNNNTLYTFENKTEYKLLKNNIILDANGGFDYRYQINPIFEVDNQPKVFEYKDSVINFYNLNTSKTALKKYEDYVFVTLNEIKQTTKQGDKQLIVIDKENAEKIKEYAKYTFDWDNVKIDYFGNLVGKNDYRDFNKIWLLKTPNYNFATYILQYTFYSGKKFDNRYNLDIVTQNKVTRFKSEELEKLRQSILLGEFYQAIKRINRYNTKSSEINIITNDEVIVNKIKNQFKGIELVNKNISVSFKQNYNTKQNKSQEAIEKYKAIILETINQKQDTISKADISNQLGLDKSNLHRFFKNEEVIRFNNLYKVNVLKHYLFIGIKSISI